MDFSKGKFLVVVVDDRATNRSILSRLTRTLGTGVQCMPFEYPAAALDWMSTALPDLIITDFNMPGMNGAEFVSRCRRELPDPDLPIIVLTAYEDREFRYRALEAGATDFLMTPLDHREFVTRAGNLLTLGRHQRLAAQRAYILEEELEKAQRQQVENLQQSENMLRQIVDTVPALVTATDRNDEVIIANRFAQEVGGTDVVENLHIRDLFGDDYRNRHHRLNAAVLADGGDLSSSFEEEISDRSSRKRVFLTTKSKVGRPDGRSDLVVTVSLDISERKEYEERILLQANFDSVTGLPNRNLLMDRLSQAIARAHRNNHRVGVLFIDLDGFKKVNDTLGHAAGDILLVEAGQRLNRAIRSADTIGRFGGDEFLVIIPDMASDAVPEPVARKLLDEMAQPFTIEGQEFYVGASIGVTLYPDDGLNPGALLRNADTAMYGAKAAGRSTYKFFSEEIIEYARRRVEMEGLLRRAIEREELSVVFQPMVGVDSGKVAGFEALLRWNSLELGPVPPDVFIPIAEEGGLIVSLGGWVLRQACLQAAAWRTTTKAHLRISVNVSYRQFIGNDFPKEVELALRESGLPAEALELEVTERILMQDELHALQVLSALRSLGVRLAIDDFGTGYASLMYLKRFPFNTLKIDKLFLADVPTGDGAALTRAMIGMAKDLGLDVVGEGVETTEQLRFLCDHGCDLYQGYLFSKPLAPAKAGILLPQPMSFA